MEKIIIWLAIMVPVSALITGIGIYALRRKKPMWFYAGTKVKEEEISDVRGFNRANGIMWIAYSLILWGCTAAGLWNMKLAGILLVIGAPLGSLGMAVAWHGIRRKYAAGEGSEKHDG